MAQSVNVNVGATDKTKGALTSVQRNLKKTSREADGLAGRFRSVARATVIMEGPLGGTAGRLSAVATMLNSTNMAAIAAGVGFAGLTAGLYTSLKAYSLYEKQTFKIEHLLTQTQNASGLTGIAIEEMADRIGKATLESADGVREASSVLLSFKSISGSTFERTMNMAADMSAVVGQDLKSSIVQLGKALEDPMTGMSALRRSGISFTNSQKDAIVAMKNTGDTAGAQAAILKLLEGQLGGAGAAAGGGLAGATDLVSHNWNKMLENMAKSGAGQAATDFLNRMARGLEKINDLMFPSASTNINELFSERLDILKSIKVLEERGASKGLIEQRQAEADKIKEQIVLITSKQKAEAQAAKDALEKGRETQRLLAEQNIAEAKAAEQKKINADAEAKFKKDKAGASSYGEKLAAEQEKFENSLLEKSSAEDLYLEERLAKIAEFEANKLITASEAHAQEQNAYAIHNAKVTEIFRTEEEKRAEAQDKLDKIKKESTITMFGDLATLMQAGNAKLFKIGKAAAYAGAIVAGQKSAAESLANGGGYPWGVPAMIGSLVKTGVNIATIAKTKMSGAKEFGGPVISGRNYLVGEKGPEMFTAPSSGRIINNNTVNNLTGNGDGNNAIRDVNVNISATDALSVRELFLDNKVALRDAILSAMNEEGESFA